MTYKELVKYLKYEYGNDIVNSHGYRIDIDVPAYKNRLIITHNIRTGCTVLYSHIKERKKSYKVDHYNSDNLIVLMTIVENYVSGCYEPGNVLTRLMYYYRVALK